MKRNQLAATLTAALAVSFGATSAFAGSERGAGYESSQGPEHSAPISSMPNFNKLDANADGQVDLTEAEGHIDAETFASADADGDNALSKSEYQQLHVSTAQSMGAERGEKDAALTASAEFATLDVDGDGYISAEEAQASGRLADQWGSVDTNADGQLDRSEFSAFETEPGSEIKLEAAPEPSPKDVPQQPKQMPDQGM